MWKRNEDVLLEDSFLLFEIREENLFTTKQQNKKNCFYLKILHLIREVQYISFAMFLTLYIY